MSLIAWILTVIGFLLILAAGTCRFWRLLFAGPQYWCGLNTNEKSASWLVEHIGKAKKSVEAVTGNLNPYVFNEVAELIQKRLRESNDLEIKILVGSEILTLENRNELLEFSKGMASNGFKLAFLDKRPEEHFRVVDETHLYVERPHPIGAFQRTAESWENSVFRAWDYHMKFQELWKDRDEGIKPRLIPIESIKQKS
ncbi:MAG: hypothetical protein KAW02_05275 [candidate division Zixibacteria bacterium]|nr:hypothetical protein [candidate division Zixibacteria bacterium]